MMMRSILLFTTAALIIVDSAFSQEHLATTPVGFLTESDSVKRRQAIEALQNQRRVIVQNLVSILDGKFSDDIRVGAARLAGEYRAAEAVEALLRNIDLDVRPKIMKGLLTEEEVRPISRALERIGNPSIPAVIRNLEGSDDVNVRELCLQVIHHIERDKEIARLRLRRATDSQLDSKKKARLQAASQALLKMESQ